MKVTREKKRGLNGASAAPGELGAKNVALKGGWQTNTPCANHKKWSSREKGNQVVRRSLQGGNSRGGTDLGTPLLSLETSSERRSRAKEELRA